MPAHPCDNLVVVENSDGMSAEEHSSLEATGGDAEEEEAMTKLSTAIVTANQGRGFFWIADIIHAPHRAINSNTASEASSYYPGNDTFNCEDEDLERRDPMPG
ncbi:uncharacterized protein ARMOST_05395 [Armillaria ostoyae]|uniref:Uncharacterized protein n=1 Tax=Armillaria ostoyae TaxID=47428 RepID=A0A284R027_ARMOS|nr:uncharacterized protein ARMOST_05395 [Armillaria ostoyae]